MIPRTIHHVMLGLALPVSLSMAGWLEDTETDRLRAELGASAPTGAGVKVVQSEAPTGDGGYYPQAGGGSGSFAGVDSGNGRDYTGVTFIPESGARTYSVHAKEVARRFF